MAKKKIEHEHRNKFNLRDVILGGQDGLVNVLGIILAVAFATYNKRIILLTGFAATFAESISMAAVAYTSSKAAKDYHKSQEEIEKKEIREIPKEEEKEIYDIYYEKGFRGDLLKRIVKKIISNKKLWLETMLREELKLSSDKFEKPLMGAFVVGFSAIIGSLIPLIPFIFVGVKTAIIFSLIISIITLFVTGAIKAKLSIGNWLREGVEMAVIGIGAAIIGFLIAWLFNRFY